MADQELMKIKISPAHRLRADPTKKNGRKMWEPGEVVECPKKRALKLISIGAASKVVAKKEDPKPEADEE